jgi:hypothetical protein
MLSQRVEVLDRAIDEQLWCLLGGEMSYPGNQLHAHVVGMLLVAMQLVRANHTVVRAEEKQRGRVESAIAVPACNQRELA